MDVLALFTFLSGREERSSSGWGLHAAGAGSLSRHPLQVSAPINSPEVFDSGLFSEPALRNEDCLPWSSLAGRVESFSGPSDSIPAVLGLALASWPVESSSQWH